ncbi:hypothetical protein [Pelomonas sp. BJYL3]|uniref:hypothetical protein n=1 Tax=Pelomonas sp. BJYL3 TaxID=2976697 RepID=UPI0022B5760F|nr:hypothetical protein [Pelomonas sp. BJYL3]
MTALPRRTQLGRLLRRTLWLMLFLGLGLPLLLAMLALQAQPSVAPPPALEGAQLQQASEVLRQNDPRQLPPGGLRVARLSEAQLQLLLGRLVNRYREARATAQLAQHEALLEASIPLREQGAGPWLNIHARLQETGNLPRLRQLRIGHLPLPTWASDWLVRWLTERLAAQAELRVAGELIQHIGFAPGQLEMSYEWKPDSLKKALNARWPAAEQARLQHYNALLVKLCEPHLSGTPVSVADVMPPFFAEALRRSQSGEDPRLENRAAFLILALQAAGEHTSRLLPAASSWPRARPMILTANGRDDFSQHLLVSVVLAIEGGGPLADAIGIYKEVADSRGGSGFSFNDLAADQAGAHLGLYSERDPVGLQRRLAAHPPERDFMPRTEDLPEFLSAEALQRQYGGLQGEGYRRMMALIRQRVDALPLYR